MHLSPESFDLEPRTETKKLHLIYKIASNAVLSLHEPENNSKQGCWYLVPVHLFRYNVNWYIFS